MVYVNDKIFDKICKTESRERYVHLPEYGYQRSKKG